MTLAELIKSGIINDADVVTLARPLSGLWLEVRKGNTHQDDILDWDSEKVVDLAWSEEKGWRLSIQPESNKDREIKERELFLMEDIDQLYLSFRSRNCLRRAGINTVSELIGRKYSDLCKIRNLGKKSINEIQHVLAEHGLSLKGETT